MAESRRALHFAIAAPLDDRFRRSEVYVALSANEIKRYSANRATSRLIDHEGGHLLHECSQVLVSFGRQSGIGEGLTHELHPAVAGGLIDAKGNVPGPQARMPTLFNVSLPASKAINQEITKPLLGAIAIVLRIHRSKNVVVINLTIESSHQPRETFCSYKRKNLVFIHEVLV
jgi:hypothetical protein